MGLQRKILDEQIARADDTMLGLSAKLAIRNAVVWSSIVLVLLLVGMVNFVAYLLGFGDTNVSLGIAFLVMACVLGTMAGRMIWVAVILNTAMGQRSDGRQQS